MKSPVFLVTAFCVALVLTLMGFMAPAAVLGEIIDAWVTDADNHRHTAIDPFEITRENGCLLAVGQLRRLAHDAQHGHPVDAFADIKFNKPVNGGKIYRAVFGKGRRRDNINPARVFG